MLVRVAIAVLTLATLAAASTAGAQEVTRASFASQADRVCKRHLERANPHLERGERLLEQRRYAKGARKMLRGVRHLRGISDVARLTRPAGDSERIARWLRGELRALDLAARGWRKVERERLRAANRLFERSREVHRRAHLPVRGYDFRVCT